MVQALAARARKRATPPSGSVGSTSSRRRVSLRGREEAQARHLRREVKGGASGPQPKRARSAAAPRRWSAPRRRRGGPGRCSRAISPQVARSAPLISPSVTRASTHARIRGTTFSVPGAAALEASTAAPPPRIRPAAHGLGARHLARLGLPGRCLRGPLLVAILPERVQADDDLLAGLDAAGRRTPPGDLGLLIAISKGGELPPRRSISASSAMTRSSSSSVSARRSTSRPSGSTGALTPDS